MGGEPLSALDPAVSVVVPTRNRRRLLLRALRSVLTQRDVSLRVIVVDDGSDDGTLDSVAALRDGRVLMLRHDQRRGVSGARNTGLACVQTRWVAFLDDDDVWAPTKLRCQLAAVETRSNASWSCVGAVSFDHRGRMLRGHHPPKDPYLSDLLLIDNVIPGGGSGVLARTELVRSVGGFDVSLSAFADWDLNIRLSHRSAIASLDRPLVGNYVHPDQMTRDFPRHVHDVSRIQEKFAQYGELTQVDWLWLERLCHVAFEARDYKSGLGLLVLLGKRGHVPWSALRRALVQLAPGTLADWARTRRVQARFSASWLEEAAYWLPGAQL